MGKFLAYFRARVLLANMSKKGNDFTVIPRIAKQRNMYRHSARATIPSSGWIATRLCVAGSLGRRMMYRTYTYGILLYYGDASF